MRVLKFIFIFLVLGLNSRAEFILKSYAEIKNEKLVRQNYEQSCGAASLATLINLISDKKLSELDILQTMSTEEIYTDMLSFADLSVLAQKLGFESKSYQIDKENLNKLIGIPLLVKIEDDPRFPHFVIIINHKGDFLQVLDPSHGEYISSKNQFLNLWDKHSRGGFALILAFEKDLETLKPKLPKSLNFDIKPFSLY
ncbi:peptidase C39 [Campylobacter sp. MIT 99-7217]|uniref:C39 family peptidase n=1 Tax=Campylobacter sp. MIT 99-7217 TaxID=535091 RepID=UPI001159317A|nr:cysteine peptidase family C39 domain-containing protein [Campylobacter sp. MIT 99-7217]TQR34432.1 peptidase C39 [Campylobacter sp. MIT 99-7217]